jgi:16S rRNA processing protein RimM
LSDDLVTLAAIAGAHGIGGEVRLKLFAESVESLQRHEAVHVGDRQLTLKSVKAGGGMPIARFAEIGDRSAAEALRGTLITVPSIGFAAARGRRILSRRSDRPPL